MWQGRKSTQDERGVAALKAIEVDDSLYGAAKQVTVYPTYYSLFLF